MKIITKYGDIGTPERHNKFGGVQSDNVDGQLHAKARAEDYLDVFLISRVINQEQFNAASQLCRDYKIGCLYKWKKVSDYLRGVGLSAEEAEEERERCRKEFYVAIKFNREFLKISDLTHLILGKAGVYIPTDIQMRNLCDRLIKYYLHTSRK